MTRGQPDTTATTTPAELDLPIAFREFVVLAALLVSLTAMSIDIMLPTLPQIGASFGIPKANDQQKIVTYFFFGMALGQLFYGPLSDRYGRKPLLLIGLAIYLAAGIAAISVSEFQHLLWARTVQGFGGAAGRILITAIVRDLLSGRPMARVMSIVQTVFIVVPMVAPAVGQGIAALGSWRTIFFFLLTVALLAFAWSSIRLPETRRRAAQPQASFLQAARAVVGNPTTLGYTIASGFVFGYLVTYVSTAQQVFVDVFKLGAHFPLAFGMIAVMTATSSFVNSRLVLRHGMRRVSHLAIIGLLVVTGLLALTSLLAKPPLALYGPLMAAAFFCYGLMGANFNAIAMQPMGAVAGMAASLNGFYMTATGALLGWFIAGQFDGTVRPVAFGFFAMACLVFAAVLATEGRKGMFRGE